MIKGVPWIGYCCDGDRIAIKVNSGPGYFLGTMVLI
jgi:hypothetical protein